MTIDLRVVDAFTDRPFAGNPAAVAIVERFPDDDLMQQIAAEMNLSETAFVVPRPDGEFDLRWFTPAAEVDLCGHATLASAHVVGGDVSFHTRSGVLACTPRDDRIEMDFPADPPSTSDAADLGLEGVTWVGVGKFDWVVELDDASRVRSFVPDLGRIASFGRRGLIITAPGDRDGIDFVSRAFAPNVGIPEDPVTGSAHCLLAELWGERTGKAEMTGEQASRRGGIVHVRRRGDRVVLGGRAVVVSEVRLLV